MSPPSLVNHRFRRASAQCWELSTERNGAPLLSDGAERGNRQKKQCADDCDRPQQQTAECEGVVTQGSQAEWGALLSTERPGHRNRRDDRQITAKQDDQAACD